MSVPEPAPENKGVDVSLRLLAYLKENEKTGLHQLVEERRAFGMAKYGQSLMSEDGRDGVEDARQELGDLLQYLYKVKLNKGYHAPERLAAFRELWAEARTLIDHLLQSTIPNQDQN